MQEGSQKCSQSSESGNLCLLTALTKLPAALLLPSCGPLLSPQQPLQAQTHKKMQSSPTPSPRRPTYTHVYRMHGQKKWRLNFPCFMKYTPVPNSKQATAPKRITHEPAPHEASNSPDPHDWEKALCSPLPNPDAVQSFAVPPTCARSHDQPRLTPGWSW